MSRSSQRSLGLVGVLLALVPLIAHGQPRDSQDDQEIRTSLQKIVTVYHLTASQLADPVDPDKAIYEGAIRGALSRLDPFSTFLDADQFQALQQQQRGVQQGFGAILNVQSGRVTVLQSLPGSPFGRAGLGPGDRIVKINGHSVASMDLQELVEVLQQARTGRVRLAVLQSGKVVAQDFELDPAELPSPTVDKKFLLTPNVGYLHLARIEESAPGEIKTILEDWKEKNLQGLILDLRDNPGGSLEPAVAIASLFLEPGQVVVSFGGHAVPRQEYRVKSLPVWRDLPLVVLVNGRTASAAEIIAAAFQDHDRAWVVGEPSFGKGVVESVMPLSSGVALALTTAQYFTPRGRSVQRPLPGTALADILNQSGKKFFSDSGRPLAEGGGVQPDQEASSWKLDPWAELLGQSTAFTNFAESYIERHGKVDESFQVDDSVLDEFERFLLEARAPIPPQSWMTFLPFLKVRIKTEMFNLIFGVARGDEVEVGGDPQVASAVQALGQAQELLRQKGQSQGRDVVARSRD